MTRKLILLDLVLLSAVVWTGNRWWQERQAIEAREQALAGQKVKPAPPPPFTPLPQVPPVTPMGYADIAQKNLWDKSRNPTVEKVLPPPKPMPSLPVLHGIMNIDGISAVFSEKADSPHKEYRPGEMIGSFRLVSVNSQEVVFDWEGKPVVKRVEDLQPRKEAERAQDARTAPAPPPAATVVSAPQGPGVDMGRGVRACAPNDSNPPGTIVDGLRKVVSETPFGQACRWEPMK